MVDPVDFFGEVVILTVIFMLLDLVVALFSGGLSGMISMIGFIWIAYNFVWAVLIEIVWRFATFVLKAIF